jgi:hypothetical protein
MDKLTTADLFSLEEYHKRRAVFRAEVFAHKQNRRVQVGPNVTLYFEDRMTMQYQIQEMLRAERIFESEAIAEELDAYNPLIPDGSNLKATMMIEYADADERRTALQRLAGVEHAVYIAVAGGARVTAIADEDLPRSTDDKTSAVHFLRFELDRATCDTLKHGAVLTMGIDHPHYRHELAAPVDVARALAADLV